MAPIRKGDGTGVIPKGISEVRKGDGTVLYSAGSAIPNSAIHQWKFDEGTDSTAADSQGSNSLSITGATWISSSDGEGGYLIDSDGADDYASGSYLSSINGEVAFSIAVTIDLDNCELGENGQANIVYNGQSNTFENSFGMSVGNRSTGVIETDCRDSSGNVIFRSGIDVSSHSGFARVCFTHDGAGNSSTYLNGSAVTDQGTNGNVNDTPGGLFVGASSSSADHWDGRSDNLIVYDSELSASEVQDDYNAQPWS